MAFDIGTLIRAAAMGGGAYQQAQRDQEDRTRQQRHENEQRDRQLKADARAVAQEERDAITEALRQEGLRLDNKRLQTPPPVPPRFRANVEGVTYEGDDIAEILKTGAGIRANTPPERPRSEAPRTPAEIEEEELRLRILRANASGAERDSDIEESQPTAEARLAAGVLTGLTGATRPDPDDPMKDLDMRAIIDRNADLQSLIHDYGLTPQQAESELRRREASRRPYRGP